MPLIKPKPLELLSQMAKKGINSPKASSCGRLFDAVAAAIGICRESCSYEGQSAIKLEALAERWILNHSEEIAVYPFTVENEKVEGESDLLYLEPRPMWQALLADLQQGISQPAMAAKFHRGLAQGIALMVQQIQYQYPEAKKKSHKSIIKMKYVSEFRAPKAARGLIQKINRLSLLLERTAEQPLKLMEICGGHTHSIFKYGIEEIPGVASCCHCDAKIDLDQPFGICDHCGSMELKILRGEELNIKSMEIDELCA